MGAGGAVECGLDGSGVVCIATLEDKGYQDCDLFESEEEIR